VPCPGRIRIMCGFLARRHTPFGKRGCNSRIMRRIHRRAAVVSPIPARAHAGCIRAAIGAPEWHGSARRHESKKLKSRGGSDPPRLSEMSCEEEFFVLGRPGSDLLFQALRLSTIGAEDFDGRVRDGIGYRLLAIATRPAKDDNGDRAKIEESGSHLPSSCALSLDHEASRPSSRRQPGLLIHDC
jgi:hypothetical protein